MYRYTTRHDGNWASVNDMSDNDMRYVLSHICQRIILPSALAMQRMKQQLPSMLEKWPHILEMNVSKQISNIVGTTLERC